MILAFLEYDTAEKLDDVRACPVYWWNGMASPLQIEVDRRIHTSIELPIFVLWSRDETGGTRLLHTSDLSWHPAVRSKHVHSESSSLMPVTNFLNIYPVRRTETPHYLFHVYQEPNV